MTRKTRRHPILPTAAIVLFASLSLAAGPSARSVMTAAGESVATTCLAPIAVVPAGDHQLAVLGSSGRRLLLIDRASDKLLHTIPLPAATTGIVVRDRNAYVTTNEPGGQLLQIDLDRNHIERIWRVGHMPTAPVVSPDGSTLFLTNRFENRVRSVELSTGVQSCVDVIREPVAIVIGPDGKHLFVANHLPRIRPFLDDENPTMYAEIR